MRMSTTIERVFHSVTDSVTPSFARRLVSLKPDPLVEERLEELAGKSSAGLLTEVEHAEYESLVIAGDLVSILQTKARDVLAKAQPTQ